MPKRLASFPNLVGSRPCARGYELACAEHESTLAPWTEPAHHRGCSFTTLPASIAVFSSSASTITFFSPRRLRIFSRGEVSSCSRITAPKTRPAPRKDCRRQRRDEHILAILLHHDNGLAAPSRALPKLRWKSVMLVFIGISFSDQKLACQARAEKSDALCGGLGLCGCSRFSIKNASTDGRLGLTCDTQHAAHIGSRMVFEFRR